MPGVKGFAQQAVRDLGEAVVKPVSDEVGRALEQGFQSVTGSSSPKKQIDPAEQQRKREDEERRKQWAKSVIENWTQRLAAEQAKVRQQNQQQTAQKQQEERQEAEVKQFKIMEEQKKQQSMNQAQLAARKTELKRGVGG